MWLFFIKWFMVNSNQLKKNSIYFPSQTSEIQCGIVNQICILYLYTTADLMSFFYVCSTSTWLTISFQSLMRVRVRPLLSVYSVRVKVAAAPHKSSSLRASLIVTSAWARLFRSYINVHHMHTQKTHASASVILGFVSGPPVCLITFPTHHWNLPTCQLFLKNLED